MRLRTVLTVLLLAAAAAPVFGGVETAEPSPGEDRFFTLVLPEAERAAYEALDDEARARYRTSYWARLDPTPTTEVNELEMEHQRRVVAAIRRFRDMSGFFIWDDRVRAMIRFGEPDSVARSGDEAPVATALWVFDDFALWFQDFGGKGVYRQGLAPLPAGGAEIRFAGAESERPEAAAFDGRAAIGEAFAAAGLSPDEGWRRAAAGAKIWAEVPERNAFAPPERRSVPFVDDAWFFAGEGGTTDVLVAFRIDGDETARRGVPVRYTKRTALRDSTYAIVARKQDPVASTGPGAEKNGTVVTVDTFALPPGPYQLVARLDEVGGLPGEARFADLEVPDLAGDHVRVTTPVTAAKISTSFRESGLYARRGFRIVPRPGGVFRHGETAGFYFEVYHVAADRDGRYYEEVTIRLEGRPGAAWTARFDGSARGELAPGRAATFGSVSRGPDSGKSVTLDTSGLPPGTYTLVVEARDLTLETTDTARAAFTVTE